MATRQKTALLAAAILAAYPTADLLALDPCTSLKALDAALQDAGDPLLKFIVREILEGAEKDNGDYDLPRAVTLIDRAIADLGAVREAVQVRADEPPEGHEEYTPESSAPRYANIIFEDGVCIDEAEITRDTAERVQNVLRNSSLSPIGIFDDEETVAQRLEHLRGELREERISYGELAELQDLGAQGKIDADDVELREAAGLPEFPENDDDTERLIALAVELKAGDDVLDELVHDNAQEGGLDALNAIEGGDEQEQHIAGVEQDASTVNNGGHDAQIRFLLKSGVPSSEIEAALQARSSLSNHNDPGDVNLAPE